MNSSLSTVIVSGLGYSSSFGVFLLLGFANNTAEPYGGASTRIRLGLGLGL